jgi:hypothetical protein
MTFRWGLSLLNKRIPPNIQGHFELFRFSKKEITLVEGLVAARDGQREGHERLQPTARE